MTHKKKRQSIEADSERINMMILEDKNFKTSINMFKNLKENIKIIKWWNI